MSGKWINIHRKQAIRKDNKTQKAKCVTANNASPSGDGRGAVGSHSTFELKRWVWVDIYTKVVYKKFNWNGTHQVPFTRNSKWELKWSPPRTHCVFYGRITRNRARCHYKFILKFDENTIFMNLSEQNQNQILNFPIIFLQFNLFPFLYKCLPSAISSARSVRNSYYAKESTKAHIEGKQKNRKKKSNHFYTISLHSHVSLPQAESAKRKFPLSLSTTRRL